MSVKKSLPKELAFLSGMLGDRATQYREAKWLSSAFDADIWHCSFGKAPTLEIDFRVKLDDESLLTDFRHSQLLDIFKCWLCVQTHFDATGGKLIADKTNLRRLRRVLYLIDYFLLNSAHFGLAANGLQALTENDLRGLLFELSTSNRVENSIYKWPKRFQFYLKHHIDGLSGQQIESILAMQPLLGAPICDQDDRLLELTDDEVIRARAWLWANGFYMANKRGEFSHTPSTEQLANLLYKDTLGGKTPKTRLVFFNRKSGVLGMREKEARPIPEIAVKMILQLEKLQEGFKKHGVLKENTRLFAFPSCNGDRFIELGHQRFNDSMDFFCDYFETPLDSEGRRYYIRQHQLRRFFAMLFFWGSAFGGMDTLRWFLGHTDISHLYHYITESTPGDVLRSVKANFAGQVLKHQPAEARELASLVQHHFGTDNFSVLDSDELDEYVEELMIEGRVEIEPSFLETNKGNSYRILIKVTPV
jgi:hypothetical protein